MDVYWLNKKADLRLQRGSGIRRRINALLTGAAHRLRTSWVPGFPRHLILDVFSSCGLHCPICPQGRQEIPRKPSVLDPDLFRTILDCFGPYLYTLTLTNWGEPLRYPHLVELVEYARKWSVYIGFSTNLQTFSRDRIERLLETDIDEIGCSIDGATEPTYQKYRVGGSFSNAIDRMTYLVRRRNELGRRTPKIRWQVLLNCHTEKEIDLIIETGRSIGVDSIVFVPIYVDIAGLFVRTPRERFDRDRDWLPLDSGMSWYNYETGLLKHSPAICDKLWDTMVIHPDGAVSPCCGVIDPQHDFGRITPGRLNGLSLFNNTSYRTARRMIRSGRRLDSGLVCSHCVTHGVLIY